MNLLSDGKVLQKLTFLYGSDANKVYKIPLKGKYCPLTEKIISDTDSELSPPSTNLC